MSTLHIRVILGRDGVVNNSGADVNDDKYFETWVNYVCEHIDAATGLKCDVEKRGSRDVQNDAVKGALDDEKETILEAIQTLWNYFCSGDNLTYKEKLMVTFAEVRETIQNDSNFANEDLHDAAFADMALVNAKELVDVASGASREDRFDAARRLAAVAIHLMVLNDGS